MIRLKLMLAAAAVIAVVAACSKYEPNGITGGTGFTGVALTTNPSSFALHMRLVPESTYFDSTARRDSTIPAHDIPLDSTLFDVTASIMPQDLAIANGFNNMTFVSPVAALVTGTDGNYVVPDTTGSGSFTVTYTDVDHAFATTSAVLPITVTRVP
ncbi:MAG: hypothetical protein M3Y05_14220 [Gemmatimonadota bacterium]|nr:hypothetical protein [Gemmatimonadota bacterium]